MTTKHEYRVEAKIINREETGYWNHQLVEVFDKKKKIGEYTRNYPTGGNTTFIPFIGEDGNWYALFSPKYVMTRIMKLPSCEDIGGEEYNEYGFCPVHFYQPKVHKIKRADDSKYEIYLGDQEVKGFKKEDIEKTKYLPIIFVAGCAWGADSSYGIQAFDIRKAHKGIIKRFNPFGGYTELPSDMELKDAINCDYDPTDGMMHFTVKTTQHCVLEKDFDVEVGNFRD